jgi:transposase
VIDMELLSVIRRRRYRDHFSIRDISRRTGLSPNTVRKYLRSDSVEPKFSIAERPSKLDPHADKLSQMLRHEAGKSRKQNRTIKQLHADLVTLGYDGSYNRVAAFARDWKAARQLEQKTTGRGVFVPLAFSAGEAFQFDWSEDWAIIGGERTKLQVAHFKLSYSRAFILRAYPQQTHEMLFDAHNHAFRMLGAVPCRGIYDNMRTAVDRIGRGKERRVNARFSAMVSHFLFEPEFCNPASGSAHHTHCSAYVAAAALYLDIYILRPPHHGQLHLANAQVAWFGGGGGDTGPTAEESGRRTLGASGDDGILDDAITAANAGKLVVAGYFQPPTKLPDGTEFDGAGHIVVVRPQDSFEAEKGPEVVTAGVKNFRSASMKFAFGDHPLAWPDNIQLFVHDTALEQTSSSADRSSRAESLSARLRAPGCDRHHGLDHRFEAKR